MLPFKLGGTAILLSLALAGQAAAANPIEGRWKMPDNGLADIAPCAEGFCITLRNGRFAGKTIGSLRPANNRYEGKLTTPADNKTYEGHAILTGNKLKLSGCVLKVLCKSQVWEKIPTA